MPVSSSTVATQIEFEPDIGGVSSGSMTMKPICGARVLRRNQQIHVTEDAAARLVQHEIAQRLVLRDEARLLPRSYRPAAARTPPTMTSPTSPSAWQLTT